MIGNTKSIRSGPSRQWAVADFGGRKLGVLLANLPVDDETKELFLAFAEGASLEDLELLENALEALYLEARTQESDDQFRKNLEELKKELDAAEDAENEEFLAKLSDIENKIGG